MIRTVILMVILMMIFMFVGNAIAGEQGMMIAFLMACAMNFFSYFFSDKMVLSHYKATEVTMQSAPELYSIVARLSKSAGLPMPKVYIVPDPVPNAFATGRNPSHAAVAATQGLLKTLSPQEIEGVLAHEMSHVKHYDILTSSVAAVFAGAIGMLANTARYNTNSVRSNRRGGLSAILGAVLLPIGASIIRFAISRTREYAADAGSAKLTGHPQWLISALLKLEAYSKKLTMKNATNETAHMFIINPLSGGSLASLFSTHPSTQNRIEHLERMTKEL